MPHSDLIPHAGGEVARSEPVTTLQLIREFAVDSRVDADKLGKLMELQERAEARDAEKQFNAAFALASAEMPRIAKNGAINLVKEGRSLGSIPFAKYEDVDKVVRSVEGRHGFTRSFLSEPCAGGILITCKLSHAAGHSERSTRQMPPDPGPGRNAMQAIGSASSYAKRYLTLDVWNIVTGGADDDGNSADPITESQAMDVRQWLDLLALEPPKLAKFWAWIGPPAVSPETIQKQQYDKVATYLKGLIRGAK